MSKLSVNELTDETGSGAPSFPNGVSVTGAALTDPEITGGIYLGGTGSANYLDDYEEGTWTPSLGGDATYTAQSGFYIKMGNVVYVDCTIWPDVLGTGSPDRISGLPFPPSAISGLTVGFWDQADFNAIVITALAAQSSEIILNTRDSATSTYVGGDPFHDGGARIRLSGTYRT